MLGASGILASADSDVVYGHATEELWSRRFPSRDVSYLLLSTSTGKTIAARWESADVPVPAGSLVKPFTAIAYAESHGFRFPVHICTAGTCWLPQGHGELGIVRAVAHSCNSYFTNLGGLVDAGEVTAVARRFGLAGPGVQASAEELAGLHGAWLETPSALAHAYAEMLAQLSRPGIREIAQGMAQSAKDGTAAGLSAALPRTVMLAKTGTSYCTHHPCATADGFVVVAWPEDSPRYVLLVREHGQTGARTAVLAGQMLRALSE
jgi:cell division protein FtsI/penicillin-binding protein 2